MEPDTIYFIGRCVVIGVILILVIRGMIKDKKTVKTN